MKMVYIYALRQVPLRTAWMAKNYPDVLRVDADGRKRKFGGRHNSCPNSPTYRKYSEIITDKLAERYKDHPAVLVWHISNEYGGDCYCDNCEKAFRVYLKIVIRPSNKSIKHGTQTSGVIRSMIGMRLFFRVI